MGLFDTSKAFKKQADFANRQAGIQQNLGNQMAGKAYNQKMGYQPGATSAYNMSNSLMNSLYGFMNPNQKLKSIQYVPGQLSAGDQGLMDTIRKGFLSKELANDLTNQLAGRMEFSNLSPSQIYNLIVPPTGDWTGEQAKRGWDELESMLRPMIPQEIEIDNPFASLFSSMGGMQGATGQTGVPGSMADFITRALSVPRADLSTMPGAQPAPNLSGYNLPNVPNLPGTTPAPNLSGYNLPNAPQLPGGYTPDAAMLSRMLDIPDPSQIYQDVSSSYNTLLGNQYRGNEARTMAGQNADLVRRGISNPNVNSSRLRDADLANIEAQSKLMGYQAAQPYYNMYNSAAGQVAGMQRQSSEDTLNRLLQGYGLEYQRSADMTGLNNQVAVEQYGMNRQTGLDELSRALQGYGLDYQRSLDMTGLNNQVAGQQYGMNRQAGLDQLSNWLTKQQILQQEQVQSQNVLATIMNAINGQQMNLAGLSDLTPLIGAYNPSSWLSAGMNYSQMADQSQNGILSLLGQLGGGIGSLFAGSPKMPQI